MNLPNKITVFRFACIPFLLAASLIQFPYHWSVALVIYFIACMSDKADGIIAGLQVFERVFKLLDEATEIKFEVKDGDTVTKGQFLGVITGDIRAGTQSW